MTQATVTVQMDEGLKSALEELCAKIGISINEAIVRFANAATLDMEFLVMMKEDPFYSEDNHRKLKEHVGKIEQHFLTLDRLVAQEYGEDWEDV